MRRRDVLIAGTAVGAVVFLPRLFTSGFTFEPIAGVPGFRQIPFAAASGGAAGAAFVGLGARNPDQQRRRDQIRANPDRALFDAQAPATDLPVALFTDYNCPFCPVLSDMLMRLEADGAGIAIRFHDLPVLGPNSIAAARAALAAAEQGKYRPVHHHLMRSRLRPGPASLRALASRFDMEPARFLQDTQSPRIMDQLRQAEDIAAVFGIIGTPALVVGRTLVVGEISEKRLRRLIRLERDAISGR